MKQFICGTVCATLVLFFALLQVSQAKSIDNGPDEHGLDVQNSPNASSPNALRQCSVHYCSYLFLFKWRCCSGYRCKTGILTDKCVKCEDPNCESCDSKQCLVCNRGYTVNEEGVCVEKTCPTGQFLENGDCTPCTPGCAECSEGNTCNSCLPEFYQDGDKCTSNCPPGSFPNRGICQKCAIKDCDVCSSETVCQTCKESTFLHKYQCVEKCPSKTFQKGSACLECGPSCEHCEDQDNCHKCQPSFDLDGGKCLLSCDVGQYRGPDKTCANCNDQNCAVCSNADDCSTCLPQFLLEDTKCKTDCSEGRFALEGSCEHCSEGCLECSSEAHCNKCQADMALYGTNSTYCVDTCPNMTFKDVDGTCRDCPEGCQTCRDKDKCDVCLPDQYYKHGDKCVFECPKGYVLEHDECVDHCGPGKFDNNGACELCSKHCKTCSSATDCLECYLDYPLLHLDKTCSEKGCPVGTVQVSNQTANTSTCENCGSHCGVCLSSNPSQCKSCMQPYLLQDGTCKSSCGPGQFEQKDRTCGACPKNCHECDGADSCNLCTENNNLWKGECQKCPDKTYVQPYDYWDRFCTSEDEVIVTNHARYSFWIEHVREDDQLADISDVTAGVSQTVSRVRVNDIVKIHIYLVGSWHFKVIRSGATYINMFGTIFGVSYDHTVWKFELIN
eukprot:Nk52_evm8s267 gene=Nk52_evmTU8s267